MTSVFSLKKFFEVPKLLSKPILCTRVNHNMYMVTDNAANIGESWLEGEVEQSRFSGIHVLLFCVHGWGKPHCQPNGSALFTFSQQQLAEVFLKDWTSSYSHSLVELLVLLHYLDLVRHHGLT